MSDFLSILSDKRRIKAQLRKLTEHELSEVKNKIDSAFEDVLALHEEERQKLAEKKQKIAQFIAQAESAGISIEELQSEFQQDKTTRKKLPPKYEFMDESGHVKSWTGQGRMPSALKKLIAQGASLDEFLIKS